MIRVKTHELVSSVQVLSRLAEMKLPVAATFKLRRVMKSLSDPLKEFDETRTALMDEYCKALPQGATTREFKSEEAGSKFNEEIQRVSVEEVTLLIQPMKISDFGFDDGSAGQSIFTTNDLIALEWLIPDEAEEDDIQELTIEPEPSSDVEIPQLASN